MAETNDKLKPIDEPISPEQPTSEEVQEYLEKVQTGAGYYKLEDGQLLFAAQAVHFPDGTILSTDDPDRPDEFRGWKFFNSKEEAYQYFNVPLEENKSLQQPPS